MDNLTISELAQCNGLTGPTWIDLDDAPWLSDDVLQRAAERAGERTGILVGRSRNPVPERARRLIEALTTTLAPGGPGRAWVTPPATLLKASAQVESTLARAPMGAQVLDHVLHRTSSECVEAAIVVESLAYSSLQSGPEFRTWLQGRRSQHGRIHPLGQPEAHRLVLGRAPSSAVLEIALDRPERHNAFDAATRDVLLEALDFVARDPTITEVRLRGNGRSFCSGGDLDEFGTFGDPVTAHLVRVESSVGLAVHRLRDRVRPLLHGACIGAGIEIPAFADVVSASADAWFQLPELQFGLIPGAGGTVSIRRRIGAWRTAWMAFSAERVTVAVAAQWGLVDVRL